MKWKNEDLCSVCISYIDANITKLLTVNDVAGAVHFSRSHIQHIFKETTGISIVQYIHLQKLALAKKLLEEGLSPFIVSKKLEYLNYNQLEGALRVIMGFYLKNLIKIK